MYLCIPICVFLAHLLLDNKLQDVPLWMRIGSSAGFSLLVWAILKRTGLVKRIEIDPVLSGAFLVFLGAIFGMHLPGQVNARAPGDAPDTPVELPVLGVEDRGINIPVPSRGTGGERGAWGGTTELMVVTRSPRPPHARIVVAVEDIDAARDHGCVWAALRDGALGFPVPTVGVPARCKAERGVPGSDIEWTGRPFMAWRWTDQPAGSRSDESP